MSTDDELPLVDEEVRSNGTIVNEHFALFCSIFLPVFGMGVHVLVGTTMLLSSTNPLLGIWSLLTGLATIPIIVVQILDWNAFWTDRRTTRNVCAGAMIEGVVGSSCFSARLTHLTISSKIANWSIGSSCWLLIFDLSIVFWALVLYIIAKPRNVQLQSESSLIM